MKEQLMIIINIALRMVALLAMITALLGQFYFDVPTDDIVVVLLWGLICLVQCRD